MPNDDLTLVREYARNNSEAAFASLVSRYINLVYSVALRQTVEVFITTGHQANAERLRAEAIAVVDDARLKSALSDAEVRIRQK